MHDKVCKAGAGALAGIIATAWVVGAGLLAIAALAAVLAGLFLVFTGGDWVTTAWLIHLPFWAWRTLLGLFYAAAMVFLGCLLFIFYAEQAPQYYQPLYEKCHRFWHPEDA